ncbi:5'-3' exoribonuclease 1 [Strigomonas culicis]|uniref:5'-3' exoribonuclease 2 n=1 Tax=Strigomonas culicis TaxID=28005 RepID=S9TWN9_9TRYP|nr:5'-3' exoribonuclease 1 [Strigomonas culicis]EPY22912.1 5'-3' exoribonuclease 1 [Strigomonas culicis]|eukprot:EPY19043.1 5'-3' exoribonuclease 1 [Strigomonas culicis]
MGVPKFFRWCAERYPAVITPFKDSPPPVDNLYLDINGIIHNCTHPNDIDASRKAPTEKEMISAMFAYLEKLFNAIQPRKYFLLAVDGVAPRAKMNQQRQRRYRAGYEMMVAREEALERGEDIPEEKDVFDSNCITPGTPFMVRVSQEFQYFITMKLAVDPAWQGCKVIFSGHDCPGEGEHKIVDFIRRRKMQPGYDPNETHCMYGLDADLVMLALATHEPHFVLLREVVTFNGGSRKERERQEEDAAKGIVIDKSYHKADEFVLFHINVLRDYLEIDVRERLEQSGKKITFDLERVLDDFVFMCFFIGNDFLPTIPTLGINDGSMLTMLQIYVDHVLSKQLYMTNRGEVDWRTAEMWLTHIGELEFTTIKARQQQEEEYQRNMARRNPGHEATSTANHVYSTLGEYKQRYYKDKHLFEGGWEPNGDAMGELKQHFVEGLMWVLNYYYQGVPSWQWYFPHYYAPMASDLVNLPAVAAKVHFDLGKPFLPHQQLLAVLPPMSYRSMPSAYWPLLRSASSPLARYFPEHIQIDREGARAPWEGIVLIPFIEEKTLLAAYRSVQDKVDPEDGRHNCLGPSLLFSYSAKMVPYELPDAMFGNLKNVLVKKEPYEFPPIDHFVPELCKGVCVGKSQLEGFDSLQSKRLYIKPYYEVGAVNIFGMPTKKESMILSLANFSRARSVSEAQVLVGKEVLVGFPHYKRARVAALVDAHHVLRAVYTAEGSFSGSEKKERNRDESEAFQREVLRHRTDMKARLGIDAPDIPILVYVHRFANMSITRKGRVVRNFMTTQTCYPMPLVCMVEDITMKEDARYAEHDREEVDTSRGQRCVYVGPEPKNNKLGAPIYGSDGVVLRVEKGKGEHFVVQLRVHQALPKIPHNLTEYATRSNWVALHEAAEQIGISPRTFTTLSSSILTSPQYGSREIGLCIKFTGKCLARVGYAKLIQKSFNPWYMGNVDIFARMEKDDVDLAYHLDNNPTSSAPKGGDRRAGGGGGGGIEKGDYVGNASINRSGSGTWYFTRLAVNLIADYARHFAPLVKFIEGGSVNSNSVDPQNFMTDKWADSDVGSVLKEIEKFTEESGILDVPMINATEEAFPWDQLRELEDALESYGEGSVSEVTLQQVSKRDLYFPVTRSTGGHLVPVPLPQEQTFHLGSRVVNCRATGSVPFGARGTIIRLLASGREAEVMYDLPFIGGTRLDGRAKASRAAITKFGALLVVTEKGAAAPAAAASPVASPVSNTAKGAAVTTVQDLEALLQRKDHIGAAAPEAAGLQIPKARSAQEAAASAPISLTAASPNGGINVGDLLGTMPGASKASSPPSAVAAKTPSIAIPAPKSAQRKSRTSYCIPEEFVSGRVRVAPHDAGLKFRKWIEAFTANEIKKIREVDTL